MSVRIITGDCRDVLKTLPDESVHCVVTSPPYFGLRDYGVEGQIGLEATPDAYIAEMVAVFREVRRVLRSDGTLWLNLGDSYAGSGRSGNPEARIKAQFDAEKRSGLKPKDLIGIPWMVAKALQAPFYTGKIKDERDRVWLAAMIDAEGCMFIHKRKVGQNNGQGYARKSDSYGAGLEVANCSKEITDRCLEITGIGSVFKHEKDRRQPLYRWQLRSNECRDIIREIYPHLVAKKHQARLLLACPSSGADADAAHTSLIALHNGQPATIDFPPPKTMFEPGWYLRQDVIWSKSNPMPESVTDRCTKAHEYLFLLTKSDRYNFDAAAIAEPVAPATVKRLSQSTLDQQAGSSRVPGKTNGPMKAVPPCFGGNKYGDNTSELHRTKSGAAYEIKDGKRNRRTVWTIATQPFKDAHFATFPPALVEPCILAGCPVDGTVLDPFGGTGTTGLVSDWLGRNAILVELNPDYAAMAERRIRNDAGLFAEVAS